MALDAALADLLEECDAALFDHLAMPAGLHVCDAGRMHRVFRFAWHKALSDV